MMKISYADFEKHMKNIVRIIRFEDEIYDVCRKAHKNKLDCEIMFPTLVDDVVDLLAILTDDRDEWISYWIYELGCGDKYEDGMITDSDGKNVRLKSICDLWDILDCEK